MILDERSAGILQLLQQSSALTMVELETHMELTRRQLQYSINKINDWLVHHQYSAISYDRQVGYYLTDVIRAEDVPVKLTKRSYLFSEGDREKVFGLLLLLSSESLSVYHFQSIASVSRNTVLKDLQRLKSKLHTYKLSIEYSKKDGYVIKGRFVSNWKRLSINWQLALLMNVCKN